MMRTFQFSTTSSGRISIDTGSSFIAPDNSQVVIAWDKSNLVYVDYNAYTFAIRADTDTVIVDGATNNPGSLTGQQLYDLLSGLFKRANTGSGGSGSVDLSNYYTKTQTDNHAGDIKITDAAKGFVLTTPTGEHIRLTAYMDNGQPQIQFSVI